jgi:hypothetical protein
VRKDRPRSHQEREGKKPPFKFVAICRGGSRAARLTTKSVCSDGRFTNRPYRPERRPEGRLLEFLHSMENARSEPAERASSV